MSTGEGERITVEVAYARPESQRIVSLDVEPGTTLTLEADFGEGWFLGDRIDWLTPVFLP